LSPAATATFRRRADNVILRWQARLDSEWSDRVLPWLFALGLFVVLELLSFAKARSLDGTVDLATYTQGAWLIHNGHEPILTLSSGSNLLAYQAAFLFFPLAWLTFLVPVQTTLLLAQSAALAIAVVPVWRIARGLASLRVGAAIVLAVVYALYPTMHNLNLAGFYPETLALPLLLYAAYFGLSSHWRRFLFCCVLVVLCRADFGLVVAGLGALVWVEGRKNEGRAALVGGLAYTVFAILVIQPHFGDGTYAHLGAFHEFGSSPGAALWGMVTQPADVVGALVREQNFNLLVTLFAPVAFLPLLAPRYLLPVLPLEFFFLVSDAPESAVYGQLTIAITAFVFLATAFAMKRVGRMGVEKIIVDRRVLAVMLLASTIFFVRDAASSPYRQPWSWGGQDQVDAARLAAADQVGADRSVRASASLLTVVAQRVRVYELHPTSRPDAAGAANGVDAVILDERSVANWTAVDRQIFREGMSSLGFTLVSSSEGIDVYVRRP
jgi:uncharacterized membrane protein